MTSLPLSDLDEILTMNESLDRRLDGSRMLVTGGTGFFGTWLLAAWAHANDRLGLDRRVVVLTRDPAQFLARTPSLAGRDDIEFVRGDIVEPLALTGKFDACVHAATAASLTLTLADPRAMFDTVVRGTANVIDALAASGDRVPLLLTSSGAVYGTQPPEIEHVSEEHRGGPDPLDRAAVYGEAKRAAEMLCAIASAGVVDCRIARCFAFVGPLLPIDAHFAIGNFVRDALSGGPIVVGGDGTPWRSYMYPTDLVHWLWTILLDGASARPYNVGSGNALTIEQTARAVAEQCQVDVEVRGTPRPGTPAARYVPDVHRAETELGLRITVGLDEAIARTLAWHRRLA